MIIKVLKLKNEYKDKFIYLIYFLLIQYMSLLSAFTTQIFNLIQNLSNIYPEDTDLKLCEKSILLLKKTNPRKIHLLFNTYIVKYADYKKMQNLY